MDARIEERKNQLKGKWKTREESGGGEEEKRGGRMEGN